MAVLVQIMAWRRPGDKPLSEAMIVSLLTHICVAPPQWVKGPIDNKSALVQVTAWHRTDDKSLPDPTLTQCKYAALGGDALNFIVEGGTWMTLNNNRAPLLCCFKLCASFCSHWWIQIGGVTVRKRQIWVKSDDFCSCVTLKIDGWH